METTYKINANELNEDFLTTLKKIFQNQKLLISIQTIDDEFEDDTAYLSSSPANKERLLKSIKNYESGKEMKKISWENIQKL
ncbi:MAG: hypothetical protein AB8B69_11960 [Chitinophagales bacterium]